eukprot:scaffold16285_cov31-Tisochrysis_lutea.AAC.1
MASEVLDFDEVSASPAYASLDQLVEGGRLTQAQVLPLPSLLCLNPGRPQVAPRLLTMSLLLTSFALSNSTPTGMLCVQVQLYKSKFAKLHQVVLKTYENEKNLLKKAKQLNGDLGNERAKLDEATKQAEEDSERVSQLRAEVQPPQHVNWTDGACRRWMAWE